jgi:hypothetical protein
MEIEGDAAELVDWTNRPGGDIRVSAASCAAFSVALWAQASWGTYQVLRFSADIVGKAALIRILDCVFGIPRRHRASADPAWLTSTVIALARGIYDDRAFDRMPILADALEDAGCDNADILAHCRDADATHVRGCWVVDLILGKE